MTQTATSDHQNAGAPGDLELVRQFVNTRDVEEGTDTLETAAGLAEWIEANELAEARVSISDADRVRAVELREALREALLTNNDAPLPPTTVDRLNAALSGIHLEVRVDPDCTIGLVPAGKGLEAALARIAGIVREAMRSGEWSRLKVCPADDCLWAFYDRSRNRSRTWCRMEECGNRAKVRTFRERHAPSS